jgi:hypothetical protein
MGRGKWIAAVSTFVCFAALFIAAATAPALNVPSVGTTGLGTALSSPTVTVPSVSIPTVTAPNVTVLKTTVPIESNPSVTTPKALPPTNVSTPKITTPSAVDPGSSVRRVADQTATGGSQTVSRATSAPQLPSRGATGNFASGRGDPSSTQAVGGGAGNQVPPGSSGALPGLAGPNVAGLHSFALLPGGAAALQLRAALEPLLGCFYSLSPFEQEVLALRAGLDGGAPISRGQLASAFGVTPIDVHRTERSALRRLRRASVEEGCVSVAGGALFASAGSAFIGGPFGPVGYASPATGPTMRPAVVVTSTDVPGRAVESRSIADRLRELSSDDGSGPHWIVFLITLLLCASLGVLLLEARRSV